MMTSNVRVIAHVDGVVSITNPEGQSEKLGAINAIS